MELNRNKEKTNPFDLDGMTEANLVTEHGGPAGGGGVLVTDGAPALTDVGHGAALTLRVASL